jgi:hypothetical protein
MVRHAKRKSTFYIPILLLVVMVGLLTLHHAGKERDQTPEGLSRNTDVVEGAKGKVLTVNKIDSGYDVHYNENEKLTNVQLNDTLEVTNKETLPIELSLAATFWAKENQAIYIEKDQLLHYDGSKKHTIDKEVEGLSVGDETVYYWKKNRIFQLDTSTITSSEIAATEQPVTKLFTSDDTNGLFAAAVQKEDYSNDVLVYQTSGQDTQMNHMFNVPSISGERVNTIDLSQNEEGTHVIYTTKQSHAGTITIRGYYNIFTGNEKEASFKEIAVYDAFSSDRMRVIKDLDLVMTESGPEVFLSARGLITPKIESWNIYRAEPQDSGKWIANHISSTKSISNNHVYASEGEIFWLDAKGKTVKIMAVSDHPHLVQKAEEYQPSDFIQGFFSGITTLPYGFILLMVSAMWIAPAAIFLFAVSFWNENAIEQKHSWVRYSTIGLFAICQYYLMQQFFTPMFHAFSPSYLSFPWHSIVLPLAFVFLSMLFTLIVRQKQWSIYQEFGYFTLFNTIFVIFLISPYVI